MYHLTGVIDKWRRSAPSTIALAVCTLLFSSAALTQTSDVRISLEEPAHGGVYTGIGNLRGWAVSDDGIDRVEVFIDGVYAYDVPDGGLRTDVGDAFPDFPESDESGFSMAFNYKSLDPGVHSITVRAYSDSGDFSEDSNTFTTSRFVSDFIARRDAIDFSTATNVDLIDPQTVVFQGIVVEDKSWDIRLRWDTATQGMEIVDITPSQQETACENFTGVWSGNLSGSQTASGGGFTVSEDYFESTAFAISQTGCSVVVQVDDPFYLPIAGSTSDNRLNVSGVPLTKADFESELEEVLFENGIIGVVTVQSIALEANATLNGTVLELNGEITARGNVSAGAQDFSFVFTDSFSGDLSR